MKRAFLKSPLTFHRTGILFLLSFCLTGAKNVIPGEILWQEGVYYRVEGRQFQQQGNLDQAASAYRKAIAVKPDYAEAYNDLGVILESTGDLAAAEEAYKTALKFKPDLVSAHSNLALLYEETHRVKEAAVHWGARVQLGLPGDPWVIKAREKLTQYQLTIPETKAEQAEQSAKEIRVAIETGKADLEAKQYDKAIVEFEQALKSDPANVQAAHFLRWAKTQAQQAQAREWKSSRGRVKKETPKKAEIARERPQKEPTQKAVQKEKTRETDHQMKNLEEARRKAPEAAKQIEAEKRAEEIQKRAAAKAVVPEQISTPALSQAQVIAREIIKEKSKVSAQTGQELNRRAVAAMREGLYQDAVDTYKQMLMLDPGNRSAEQGLERAQKALAREVR